MTHTSLKKLALGASLCSCLAFAAHAENTASSTKTDAAKPASTQAAPAQTAPTQPAKPADPLNLNEKQKAKMTEWGNLQKQHYHSSLKNQQTIEDLASAEHYDEAAVKAAASKMGKETEQYYLDYASKNHEFVTSLSPEQRVQMEKLRATRKEQLKKKQQQLEKAYSKPADSQPPANSQPTANNQAPTNGSASTNQQ